MPNPHEQGKPQGHEGFRTVSISDAIAAAEFNEAGIAMTPLVTTEVGGHQMDELLVSMRPGVGVPVHLHEHGGETQRAITPIRGIFGEAKRDGDGGYDLTPGGQVRFDLVEDRVYSPDDVTSIPEGFVHGFGNPSRTEDAHIVFNLPHTHATGEDKKLADDEVAALAEAIPDQEFEELAGEQPLAIVRRKLGHIAHDHTPPREQG